jgi:N-methylhydantoinase A
MRADGSIEQPLDRSEIARIVAEIAALEAETVAIALINAYANPLHERQIAAALAQAQPDLPVSLSSAISPEVREYERTSTTVLNALLVPIMRAYLARLKERMEAAGMTAPLLLVQSNSGVCSADIAATEPARLLLSGPSGGALAALKTAAAQGIADLVGIDMGGTSFDVSVVHACGITQVMQGEVDGLPVRLPMVEIRTIGAGGGSIAGVDAGGRLNVGPRSAGARPGPACYGQGGEEPTVTDANLVLGRLDPAFFLGGAMTLHQVAARRAIETRVGTPLGLDLDRAAEGMLTVTNANLAAAIRLSLFEKGLDIRDFALLSFGGAGGLHAIPVAEELGISRVIFPPDASTFSAYGILYSDIVHDLAWSRLLRAGPECIAPLAEAARDLRMRGAALLEQDGIARERREMRLAADMRYHGQAFEIPVPWGDATPSTASLPELIARFHELHQRRFSYANPHDIVEIVTLRLSAIGRMAHRDSQRPASSTAPRVAETRRVFLNGNWRETPVYRRAGIAGTISGPAIVEEEYTTILLSAGWRLAPASQGALLASKG